MIVKVDLEKAYDRLEWSFIQETLEDAGFPGRIWKQLWDASQVHHKYNLSYIFC